MDNKRKNAKNEFLCPKSAYRGQDCLDGFIFNSNLQEFTHRLGYISGLHTNGKLSSQDAFQYIEQLWEKVEVSPPKPWRSSK